MALKINKQTWLKLQMNSKAQQPNTNINNNNTPAAHYNQIGNSAF
jgi:hypothetical protein